jgi:hypothetical protein
MLYTALRSRQTIVKAYSTLNIIGSAPSNTLNLNPFQNLSAAAPFP